jgi:probable HAF family extracellular repeat protein
MNRFLATTTLLCGLWSTAASAANYQIFELGTLGGGTSFALDVNENRQVTGNSQEPLAEPAPRLNAFYWDQSSSMSNVGVLSGSNNFSRGYAINDAGVIVGESDNNSSRAFVYNSGAMVGLTRLAGDNDRGVAHSVNNSGVIVGISSNGSVSRATKWLFDGSTYVPSDLGTVAGTTAATGRAWDVNDSGVAVGLSSNAAGTSQATMWNDLSAANLGSLGDGAQFSQAYAVNEANIAVGASLTGQTVGELIGTSSTTSVTRAFVWQSGAISELSPLNLYTAINNGPTTNYHSVAMDVNGAGLIVGNSQRIAGAAAVATLWKNGQAIDLNAMLPAGSGWTLLSAEGINDRGDIVGYGSFGGQTRAFLMTVPEPTTLVGAVVGMLGIAIRRRSVVKLQRQKA